MGFLGAESLRLLRVGDKRNHDRGVPDRVESTKVLVNVGLKEPRTRRYLMVAT